VPDGYALVPAIPTEAMTDAYWRAVVLPDNARLSDRPKAVARWQAMLSAAPLPQHPPAEPAARAQVGALGFARPAELDDVRRNKDSHAAIAIFLQPEKSDAHSVPIYTHPSPAHAGAGIDIVKLANLTGVYYPSGRIAYGGPLYAFTPDELAEFARRLAGGDHA